MSETFPSDFEGLLRRALAPVEPPDDLAARMEATLSELTGLAQDELEGWELSSMRDPRNWARPVAAAAIGSTAAVGLVLVRTQRRRHTRRRTGFCRARPHAHRTHRTRRRGRRRRPSAR